jgi:hypothetical protein
VLRPPVAQERVELRPNGLGVRLTLKKAYADGTIAVDMDPLSLLCRLATSVLPPRRHTIRYSGVLAPASPWRRGLAPMAPSEPWGRKADSSRSQPTSLTSRPRRRSDLGRMGCPQEGAGAIRNQQVLGSIPSTGSNRIHDLSGLRLEAPLSGVGRRSAAGTLARDPRV